MRGVRLFSGEGRGNWYLVSRASLAARLPEPGLVQAGCARHDVKVYRSQPVLAGTDSHRAGYRGGGAARNRVANGIAEADAGAESGLGLDLVVWS